MNLSYFRALEAGGLGEVSTHSSWVLELRKERYQRNMCFTSEMARYEDSIGESRPRTIRIQRS
jgi:hypothetical protein